MVYTTATLVLGTGSGDADGIQTWLESRGRGAADRYGIGAVGGRGGRYTPVPGDLGQAIVDESVRYRSLGIVVDDRIAAAQIDEETAGWQSEFARVRNNPGGIGAIDNDPNQAYTFGSVRAGVRAHMAHLLTYAAGRGPWNADDKRFAFVPVANIGRVRRIADLAGTWASSLAYADNIVARANLLESHLASSGGGQMVDISGFTPPRIVQQWFQPNGVSYLGEVMDFWGVCIHQTGNSDPGSEAQQNVNYMKGPAAIARLASWHATVGLDVVIETIPSSRQAFHASDGDGPGNTHFMAIEGVMCYPVGSPEFRRVMRNHAWYAATKLREHGKPIVPIVQDADWSTGITVGQHNSFARDNKDCPQFYRDHGLWPEFVALMRAFDAKLAAPPDEPAEDPNARLLSHVDYGDHWIINLDTPDGRVEMYRVWKDGGELAGWGFPLSGMTRQTTDAGVPVYRQPFENAIGEFYPRGWDGRSAPIGRKGGIPQNWNWYASFVLPVVAKWDQARG